MRLAPAFLSALLGCAFVVAACGGKAESDEDAGVSASSSSGGSSAGGGAPSPVSADAGHAPSEAGSGASGGGGPTPTRDAGTVPVRDAATVRCTMGGGGGSGSGGSGSPPSCEIMQMETCAGQSYQVSCTCPQGSCACFGATTNIVPFTGCPACPSLSQAFAICGFPQ